MEATGWDVRNLLDGAEYVARYRWLVSHRPQIQEPSVVENVEERCQSLAPSLGQVAGLDASRKVALCVELSKEYMQGVVLRIEMFYFPSFGEFM